MLRWAASGEVAHAVELPNGMKRERTLLQRARHDELGDLVFAVPEDLLENVLIVAPERRRGTANGGRRPREREARALDDGLAALGVLELDEVPAMEELRVAYELGRVLDGARRQSQGVTACSPSAQNAR